MKNFNWQQDYVRDLKKKITGVKNDLKEKLAEGTKLKKRSKLIQMRFQPHS